MDIWNDSRAQGAPAQATLAVDQGGSSDPMPASSPVEDRIRPGMLPPLSFLTMANVLQIRAILRARRAR